MVRRKPNKNNRGLKWNSDKYWETAGYNSQLFNIIQTRITDMALTRYQWINLPETCDERFLELTLLSQGQATIAFPRETPNVWYSLAIGSTQSTPDMYGYPKLWSAIGLNGFQFNVTKNNGFYVYDNRLRVPIQQRIDVWAREMVDILRTMQQNRVHQKLPLIIYGLQQKQLDMAQYAKQVAGGEIISIASNGIDDLNVKTLSSGIPYLGNELWITFQNILQNCYSDLGIQNMPYKAERVIESEINTRNDPTNLTALDGLTERRKLCDYLNNHFGCFKDNPLDVVWRSDNVTANYNLLHNLQDFMQLDNDYVKDSDNNGISRL